MKCTDPDCRICEYDLADRWQDHSEESESDSTDADSETFASIGWGTDEDYGYYGEGE